MNKTGKVLGSIFIILGVLFLLSNLGVIEPFWNKINIGFLIGRFWPILFLLLPGLIMHLKFFSGTRRDPGVLVPGGILLVLGAAFQINMLFGGWDILWPVYVFSVAFGLFELYTFGTRDRGLLIPIGILGGLSVLFFLSFSANKLFSFNTRPYIVPVFLIGVGIIVLFGGRGNKGKNDY